MSNQTNATFPPPERDPTELMNQLAAAERTLDDSRRTPADVPLGPSEHAHLLRKAVAALRSSEQRYRTLVENSSDVIALVTAGGTLVYDSPAIGTVLGYSSGELVGRSMFEFIHPDDSPKARRDLERVRAKPGQTVSAVLRIRHRSGDYRWLEGTGTNLLEEPGVTAIVLCYRDVSDRVRVTDALATSEARYRTILQGLQAGVVVHAPDFRVISCNARALELLGVNEDQMYARQPMDPLWSRVRLDGTNFPDEELPYRLALRMGQPVRDMLIGVNRPDSSDLVWLQADANPIRDGAGRVEEVIVTFMDVTRRVHAEQQIRNTATFTEDVLNSLVAHVVVLDERGTILAVNEAWRRFARENGAGDRDFIGSNYLRECDASIGRGDGSDAAAAARAIRAVLQGECAHFTHEYPCRTADESRWFRLRVSPLSGGRRGVVVSHHDITEQRRSLDEVQASGKRFKTLFEQAAVGVALTDVSTGRYVQVNERFCAIVGRTREEMAQLSVRAISHPHDIHLSLDARSKLAGGAVREVTLEKRYLRKDGTEVWASVTLSAMWAVGEKPDYVIAVVQDISERKMLEEQFRQAQKMDAVGQLSGGVAHDFNNLLTVIKGHIGLLEGTGQITAAIAESLDQISAAADRATNLTRQLLMFSRRQVMQPCILDLHSATAEMAKMLRRMVGEQVAIDLKRTPAPLLLRADAGMIDQILLNLTVNARDAMPEGGRIEIETSLVAITAERARRWPAARAGTFACLSVRDTGVGIPLEIRAKIFEPFFTTKGVGQGTGLGLATVYGIVRQHEGWIDVQSEVNVGSTFAIYLPCTDDAFPAAVLPTPSAAGGSGTETILVVEDEPAVRMMIESLLLHRGYRVRSAATGLQALEIWMDHGQEIDLLLTDMVMPDKITGRALAEQLVRQKPKLRVIYVSGYSPEFAGKDFPLREGENFLAKPFDSNRLLLAVRGSLDSRSGRALGAGTPGPD